MQLVVVFFIALLGLAVGSFVNVVIYRTLNGDSPITGRSYCDHCKKKIAWYDNIPLVSFLLLKGKCRRCSKPISWQYPIVEFLTMVLFLWWYLVAFSFFRLTQEPFVYLQPVYWLSVGVLLLIVFIADLMTGLIPDLSVVGLGVLSLIYRGYLTFSGVMMPIDLWRAIIVGIVLAVFFAMLILATRGKGMGWGDVKLVLVMGFLMGYPRALVGVMLAFILGALVGVSLIVMRKRKFGQTVPFGPFLVIGTVMGLLWGERLVSWYLGLM